MQKAIKESWQEEWIRTKPLIAKAVKHQDAYTIDDIEDKIREGIFLLWASKNSAVESKDFTVVAEKDGQESLNILDL
jgi:hypothetical protein